MHSGKASIQEAYSLRDYSASSADKKIGCTICEMWTLQPCCQGHIVWLHCQQNLLSIRQPVCFYIGSESVTQKRSSAGIQTFICQRTWQVSSIVIAQSLVRTVSMVQCVKAFSCSWEDHDGTRNHSHIHTTTYHEKFQIAVIRECLNIVPHWLSPCCTCLDMFTSINRLHAATRYMWHASIQYRCDLQEISLILMIITVNTHEECTQNKPYKSLKIYKDTLRKIP